MNLYNRRILINRLGIGLSMLAMAFGLLALLWILFTFFQGLRGAELGFLYTGYASPR